MMEQQLHYSAYTLRQEAVRELTAHTTRTSIFLIGCIWLVWHFIVPSRKPDLLLSAWQTTVVLVLAAGLTLYFLNRNYQIALTLWLTGLLGGLTTLVYLAEQPEFAYLYVLIPLVAIVTTGWLLALIMEVAVLGLLWWLGMEMPALSLGEPYTMAIITSSLIALAIGWVLTSTTRNLIEWYIFSFTKAREKMDEARQHRAQMLQLFKDLDHAYYRLDRTNAALVAARKTAEEAERFKTEFVANVSHELRTPLNLIVGFTEMMMTSPESYNGVHLPGPYRSDVNAVNRSAQHLLSLVDDVLDLARIEAGKLPIAREDVALDQLVHETVRIVQGYITAKGLELRLSISDELPPMFIDRLRIRQVLLNLLVNAARHTDKGYIEVTAGQQDEEVVVRIADSGTGISADDLSKIFEEFRSTEQPFSEWHSGTGLGLPISKRFVEMHHGRMGVESTRGVGTTFWFTLPCKTAPGMRESQTKTKRFSPLVRLGASERIVVVIHEDLRIANLLRRYIDGFRVLGVADLDEGIQLANEMKAIAIVTNCAPTVANFPPDVVVFSLPLPSTRAAATNLGVQDILVKPVSRQELHAAINRVGNAPKRVLVVDDDPEVVRLFRRMLRSYPGIDETLSAYNGEEALQTAEVEQPDLILLDLIMPVVNGRTFLNRMTANPKIASIPVILVSARGQDHINLQFAGSIHIAKEEGFKLGELISTLETVLHALSPGWDRLESKATKPSEAPVASLVLEDNSSPPM